MPEACLVCREHSGDVPVPGGLLVADDSVIAFHQPPLGPESPQPPEVYLGYLMVTPRRHAPGFADLDNSEAAAMGMAMARLSRALRALDAQRVYVAVIGHHVPHLHVHLVPRWPETPPDVRWSDVDTWPGARRGTFEEAAAFAATISAQLHA
ncbi:MAG: HIT family protein [Actinomycetes bacterium]